MRPGAAVRAEPGRRRHDAPWRQPPARARGYGPQEAAGGGATGGRRWRRAAPGGRTARGRTTAGSCGRVRRRAAGTPTGRAPAARGPAGRPGRRSAGSRNDIADFVGVLTYGTTADAEKAGARVRAIHRRLHSTGTRTGETYGVDEPRLLLWGALRRSGLLPPGPASACICQVTVPGPKIPGSASFIAWASSSGRLPGARKGVDHATPHGARRTGPGRGGNGSPRANGGGHARTTPDRQVPPAQYGE